MARQLLERGAQVLSSDGAELGLVRSVRGPLFLVEAPGEAYWLPTVMIRSLSPGAVGVGFARNELATYASPGQGLAADG